MMNGIKIQDTTVSKTRTHKEFPYFSDVILPVTAELHRTGLKKVYILL